jgi:formate-dependent nitrite reductase membrane component NrfD
VRRPEKDTKPKLFYKGAHQSTLDPLAAQRPTGDIFAWAQQAPEDGHRINSGSAPGSGSSSAAAILAYDVGHTVPWDWRVGLYTWTKSIAAGVYAVLAALVLFGALEATSALWTIAAPVLAGGFLAATGAVLVWDLEHPGRFHYILTRPQWDSWLVRGAVILSGYAAVLAVHFLAGLLGGAGVLGWLAIVGVPLAIMTAVYTAFLFAQAKARDLWQNPLLPPHLVVQAAQAGAADRRAVRDVARARRGEPLAWIVATTSLLHLLLVLGELTLPHPTAHARTAAHELHSGRFATPFRVGIVLSVLALAAPSRRSWRCRRDRGAGGAAAVRARVRPSRPVRPARLSGPTGARSVTEDLDQLAARVSAARADTEARGETFYPGPSRIHLAMFPPKERWDDWVELDSEERGPTGREAVHAGAHDLLQLRVGLRAARLRGQGVAAGPQVRGQPRGARVARPQLRQGAGGHQPGHRPRPDPVPDEAGRPARVGRLGADRLGRGARHARARIRAAITEDRANEVMYHVGRPGEDGFTERVLGAWGVDGHNSHTNVCSSGGRAGYQFWMGIDRPSPDHANAEVIFLISAHLETGHYFNPHAQRITEAKAGREAGRARRAAVQHGHPRRPLARALPGQRGGDLPRDRQPPHPDRPLRPRVRAALVELARVPHRRAPRPPRHLRDLRGGPARALRGLHVRVRRGRVGVAAAKLEEVAELVASAGVAAVDPQLAVGGGRQRGRLAGLADAVPAQRPARGGGGAGRDLPQRVEQVRRRTDPPAARTRRRGTS